MKSVFLSILLILVIVNRGCAIRLPRAEKPWVNKLRTMDQFKSFLNNVNGMARETISLNNKSVVVMGPHPNGTLTLEETLRTFVNVASMENGLVISIPTIQLYRKALPVLKNYTCSRISLAFYTSQGPNGGNPPFTGSMLSQIGQPGQWPSKNNIVIEQTTSYDGPEKGYSGMQLTAIFKEMMLICRFQGSCMWSDNMFVDLGMDLYHASHTKTLDQVPLLEKFHNFHFHCDVRMMNEVNVEEFAYMLKKMTPERVYLNAPYKLQGDIIRVESKMKSGADRIGHDLVICFASMILYTILGIVNQ